MPTIPITIVTPSYNQGEFIEDTILSVTGQNYPNLEYLIYDGLSNDNSLEIIKKYENHISFWCSEKDQGQADAINKGFLKSSGDIMGWLNSDDLYLPGTLLHIASKIDTDKAQIIFGNCIHFNELTPDTTYGSNLEDRLTMKHFLSGSLIQPSSFWTRKAWEKIGPLESGMHYAFDLEWYNRAKKLNVEFVYTPRHLSLYRIHENHKTAIGGNERLMEIAQIYGRYKGAQYQNAFEELILKQKKILWFLEGIKKLKISKTKQNKIFSMFFKGLTKDIDGDDFLIMLSRIRNQ